jgi:DHA1 family tetracycline resistance protein-like MFS transporter
LAPSIVWLFLGRVIAGITGASVTTASAYIADISTDEDRAKNFGLIGAALDWDSSLVRFGCFWDIMVPEFLLRSCGLCLNFLYGYFILPESLDKDKRREFNWKRANPVGSFKFLGKHPEISGLIVSLILIYIAGHAVQSNWSFFTMYKFNWNERMVGISLGVVGLLVGLVQGGLIRWTTPKLGEEKAFITVLLCMHRDASFCICYTGLDDVCIFSSLLFRRNLRTGFAVGNYEKCSANEQGELQGALTSLMSATSLSVLR